MSPFQPDRDSRLQPQQAGVKEIDHRTLEFADDWMTVLDLQGHIRYMNRKGRALLGFVDGTVAGSWVDCWPTDVRAVAKRAMIEGRTRGRGTFRATGPAGSPAPQEWDVVVTPVFSTSEDIVALLVVSRDTSELIGARPALRDRELMLDAVVRAFSSCVVVLDESGVVTYASRSWDDFALSNGGVPEAVGIGVNYLDVCRRASTAEALDAYEGIRRVMARTHTGFTMEYSCHSPGELRWFIMHVDPMEGPHSQVVVTHTNVTPLKLAEARLAESEQIDDLRNDLRHIERVTLLNTLTSSLVHDIYQPLTALNINARVALRMLGKTPQDVGEIRSALLEVVESGQRASRLLGSLRDMMKRRPGAPSAFDLNQTLRDVARLVGRDVERRRVAMTLDLAPALSAVEADRIQIQQVILNLVLNACEAISTTPDSYERRVWLRTSDGIDGRIVVTVADSGPGVTEDQLARLFDPFYTTKPDGLGLGLSMCRDIVEAHGGVLRVVPNPDGRGLLVSFDIAAVGRA